MAEVVVTPGARRLASKDPADHPNAVSARQCVQHAHGNSDGPRCAIKRPHAPHPYGPIHPDGGLSHWCLGRTI